MENPIFTPKNKAELKAVVKEYDRNKNAAIQKYGYIQTWNVGRITDMSKLFLYLQNFNEDISSWDTSNVTNMNSMFRGCSSLNRDLTFDTSNVRKIDRILFNCPNFRGVCSFNLDNVEDLPIQKSTDLQPPPDPRFSTYLDYNENLLMENNNNYNIILEDPYNGPFLK